MDENTNKYTFPFNTCEKKNENGIAQPYSSLVNFINCLIIFYFLSKTKTKYTFILLFSILCFQLFHLFSHIIHIKGSFQTITAHFLTYSMNIAFFYTFYCYTKVIPNYLFIFYLLLIVCFDIYCILYSTVIYYILTQSVIFISILAYYFSLLPKFIQKSIYQITFIVFIIILLVSNEKNNCEKMQDFYPHFPYHIFIEIFGIFLFYIICSNFYKL